MDVYIVYLYYYYFTWTCGLVPVLYYGRKATTSWIVGSTMNGKKGKLPFSRFSGLVYWIVFIDHHHHLILDSRL